MDRQSLENPHVSPFIPDDQADYYGFEINTEKKSWLKKFTYNLKYNFKTNTNSSIEGLFLYSDSPLVLLGELFPNSNQEIKTGSFLRFKEKFKKLFWVSYRSHFRPLNTGSNKQYTSDIGWGCAIRVGQMLLLNTLKIHFSLSEQLYPELLKTIEENLVSAPYSLHNILQLGGQGKLPGDFFSPVEICYSLSKVLQISPCEKFKILIATDCLIFRDQIYANGYGVDLDYMNQLKTGEIKDPLLRWENGILLLIPLMLGKSKIEAKYYKSLQFFLSCKFSVGIIGLKQNSALYLIGYQEDQVIVMDPHHTKKACKDLNEFKARVGEYFSHALLTVNVKDLGSSMAVGFYIKNNEDFCQFEQFFQENEEIVQGLVTLKDQTTEYFFEETSDESDFIVL